MLNDTLMRIVLRLSPGSQEALQQTLPRWQVTSSVIKPDDIISSVHAIWENVAGAFGGPSREHDSQSTAFVHGGTECVS